MSKIISVTATSDTFVRNILRANFSSRQIIKLKRFGKICVNGKSVFADYKVQKGDELTFEFEDELRSDYSAEQMDLKIIYEDEDFLICDKGRNITCTPTGKDRSSIFNGLKFLYPDTSFHVLTRLDKDTLGLVLLAKNSLAASQIRKVNVNKCYLMLAEGIVEGEITVNEPILSVSGLKRIVSKDGKESCTVIRALYVYEGNTVCECELITGRTHQIRVHSAYIGHPIVGDTLYGNYEGDLNGGQKLICSRLSFIQPFTGVPVQVESKRNILQI